VHGKPTVGSQVHRGQQVKNAGMSKTEKIADMVQLAI